jgi:hypothetical protein
VFAWPAVFFEYVLDLDQFVGVSGDVESNGVSSGFRGKLLASTAAIAKIANLPEAHFIWLRRISRRSALARKSITKWQARGHAPGAGLESRHWKKIRARHCPV